jgi:hypothetical protein
MSEQSGRGEPGADRARNGRPRQPNPGADLLSDLQRWLIRSSAKNMRRELEDQVRRTLGGQRQEPGDIWDKATTEIPPDVGEAPECQWCPICRAARRMRDSGPGLAGQLSGAGDAVATAVQDALGALDTLLARTGSTTSESQGGAAAGDRGDRARAADSGADEGRQADSGVGTGAASVQHDDRAADAPSSRPESLAGEHGPGGWKPGDRLATAGTVAADPWATATAGDATEDGTGTGQDAGPDGHGHGPGDRS